MGRGARRSQSSLVGELSGRSTGTDCPRPQGGIAPVAFLCSQHTETKVKETFQMVHPQIAQSKITLGWGLPGLGNVFIPNLKCTPTPLDTVVTGLAHK